MIKSMTAFSQASHTHNTITADVTIRSYNSRYLDIALHCPESCQAVEDDIKKIISKTHNRGRVEIRLSVQDETKDLDLFEVDEKRAASYYKALDKINQDLGLKGTIDVSTVLSAKNIIVPAKKEQDTKSLWAAVSPCIEEASLELDKMRKLEGDNLFFDLNDRINYIETHLKQIEIDVREIPPMYKKRLMERISYLAADTDALDPVRLSQEAAILADKSDVSEEIVRLYSHIKMFREIMDDKESQGRKLNFLIQEFNREFNTIGSKAGKATLSHQVVDLKSELEKIREQVQNIE
ncbi:MAG: YicC family protein [Desulfobacula sp.]|nr:YicC family protein [Desulfobacula sp.]